MGTAPDAAHERRGAGLVHTVAGHARLSAGVLNQGAWRSAASSSASASISTFAAGAVKTKAHGAMPCIWCCARVSMRGHMLCCGIHALHHLPRSSFFQDVRMWYCKAGAKGHLSPAALLPRCTRTVAWAVAGALSRWPVAAQRIFRKSMHGFGRAEEQMLAVLRYNSRKMGIERKSVGVDGAALPWKGM